MGNKHTEITIETTRVVNISGAHCVTERCPECDAYTQWATVETAALRTQLRSRQLFLWVEAGCLHGRESPQGLLLICLRSLSAHLERRTKELIPDQTGTSDRG